MPALLLPLGLLFGWGWFFPDLAEYHRSLILQGEWWRIFTGHFAHWGAGHLAANLFGLLVLGFLLRRSLGPRLLLPIVLIATPAGSLALWLLLPEMELYRGASGLVWAFGGAWVSTAMGSELRTERLIALALAAGLALLSLLLPLGGISVSSLPAGIGVAWPVHLAGFGVGFVCGRSAKGGCRQG